MSSVYPFKRLIVYNDVKGGAYVTWEWHPLFKDSGSYQFSLFWSEQPDNSPWELTGTVHSDVFFLTDVENPLKNYSLNRYYKVKLATSRDTYWSPVGHVQGQLRPTEWKVAREIYRKEELHHRRTAVPVLIYKKKTYGEPCSSCTDAVSGGSKNSRCQECFGTGYSGGFLPVFGPILATISPSQLKEMKVSNEAYMWGTTVGRYQARMQGLPTLNAGDILVDESTTQRFEVSASTVIAQSHRVPLVQQLDMVLLPYTDPAYDIPDVVMPDAGCGQTKINHNYGGTDNLAYKNGVNGIQNAQIQLFEGDERLFSTTTDENGRWNQAFMAPAGTFTVIFSKGTEFGPDTQIITVEETENGSVLPNQASDVNYLGHFGG